MKKILFAMVLIFFTASTFAWDKDHKDRDDKDKHYDKDRDHNKDNDKGNTTVTSSTTATSSASATSNQSQKQDQAQSANAFATGNGSNSNNTTVNYPRQTPFAYAPEALPTSPCIKGYSAGASSPLLGGSFGGGKIDKGCEARETSRAFALLGNPTAAAKLLCSTDAAKRAKLTLDDCLAMQRPEPVAIPQAPAPVQVIVAAPVTPSVAPNVALVVAARKKKHNAKPCPAVAPAAPQEK